LLSGYGFTVNNANSRFSLNVLHTTRHFSKGVDFFSLRTPPSPLKAGTAARKNQSLLLMKSSLSSGLAQTYKLVSGASGRFQGIEAGIEA